MDLQGNAGQVLLAQEAAWSSIIPPPSSDAGQLNNQLAHELNSHPSASGDVVKLAVQEAERLASVDGVDGAYIIVNSVTGQQEAVADEANEEQTVPSTLADGDQPDLGHVPSYVYKYAPLVHLFSGEEFWPSDMQQHLYHMDPYVDYTDVSQHNLPPNVSTLALFNKYGPSIYMHSKDNVEDRPAWLESEYGVPRGPASGKQAGLCDAPAILIAVDKGDGVVDAFWFFFYSYNLGNKVLGIRFGNHVGDWEHTMVRFKHGKPTAVYYSEHAWGSAYTYEAVEKQGKRPISYSATGSHAMYATPGIHTYKLPFGLLHDETDRGPLWDPAKNAYAYVFNAQTRRISASSRTPDVPISWFYYLGHWGDKAYPLNDKRQYQFVGQYHYVDGPTGPRFKNLDRRQMCQGGGACVIKDRLEVNDVREWPADLPIGTSL